MRLFLIFSITLWLNFFFTIAIAGQVKIFTDKSGGYQFAYPIHWRLEDLSSKNHLIRLDLTKNKETGIQVRIYKNFNDDFQAYVTNYIDQFKKDMHGYWGGDIYEIDRVYSKIANLDGCQISLVFERKDGKNWFFKQYLWPYQKKVYVFQCGTPLELRDENEPIIDKIAASFQITMPPSKNSSN